MNLYAAATSVSVEKTKTELETVLWTIRNRGTDEDAARQWAAALSYVRNTWPGRRDRIEQLSLFCPAVAGEGIP